jgi:hypothetical protein
MKKPKYLFKNIVTGPKRTAQCYSWSSPYDYDSPVSVYKLSMYEFADFEPDFGILEVDKKFRVLTDYIHAIATGLKGIIVSERLLKLLQSFKLPPHRIYPIPLQHRGLPIEGYSFIHLPHPPAIQMEHTTEQFEAICDADPNLKDVAFIKLHKPMHLAKCWMTHEFLRAIIENGITGVNIHPDFERNDKKLSGIRIDQPS